MKKLEDRITDLYAQEVAHREFFESKIEELVRKDDEITELQWALLRSEEANRTLEQNQIRMVAVIDEMQSQLQDLRYELGYGATDAKLAEKPRR